MAKKERELKVLDGLRWPQGSCNRSDNDTLSGAFGRGWNQAWP